MSSADGLLRLGAAHRAWLDALLSVVGTMIVVLDRAGRVVEVSAETCRVLDAPREQVVGRDWFETFLPAAVRPAVRAVAAEILAGRLDSVERYENPVLTASGAERTVRWHNTLLRGPGGEVEAIVSSGVDVTDRAEAEAALRAALEASAASERRYRTTFHTAATPIVRLAMDGTILDCNRRVEAAFGHPAAALVGRPVTAFVHPSDHPRVALDLAEIAALGTYQRRRYRLLHADGSERVVEVDAAALPLEGNAAGEVVCQVADVTARSRAADLERLAARLLQIAHRHDDLSSLAIAFCEALREAIGYPRVAVRRSRPDGALEALAGIGVPEPPPGGEIPRGGPGCGCAAVLRGEAPPGSGAFSPGGSFVMRDCRAGAGAPFPWSDACRRACLTAGIGSLATVPIRQGGAVLGLLQVASDAPDAIPDDMVVLLEGAALQLGLAMRRIAAEQDLRRQTAFQQALLDAIPIPVSHRDDDGTTAGRNRAWLRALGAGTVSPAGGLPGEAPAPDNAEVPSRAPGGVPVRRLRDRSGQLREVELHRARFVEGEGAAGSVIALVDITALSQATAALRDLNRTLEGRIAARDAEISALHALARDLSCARSVEDVARATLHRLHGGFPVDACALALRDGARSRVFARSSGPLGAVAAAEVERRLAAELRRLGQPGPDRPLALACVPPKADAGPGVLLHLDSICVLPLQVDGRSRTLGVLLVAAQGAGALGERHAQAFALAAVQVAQAARRVLDVEIPDPAPRAPRGAEVPANAVALPALLDHLPQALLVLDARQVVVLANRVAVELLGLPDGGLPPGGLPLEALPWDAGRLAAALLPRAMQVGENVLPDLRFRDALGRPGLLRARVVPLDGPAQAGATLVLAEDASLLRAEEARLVQTRKMESIGQLAAGIAHEINTPTQYVADNLEFIAGSFRALEPSMVALRDADFSEHGEPPPDSPHAVARDVRNGLDLDYLRSEIPQAIEQAREGVGRIAAIVGAMREFSHGPGGEKVVTDLNRCVRSTVAVARHEWRYVADLSLDLDPDLPSLPTHPAEVNQILLNLLVNAAQAIAEAPPASGRGAITVRTERAGDGARVEVIDNGCGIPFELQHRVFEPFFTTKPVGRGTGQGLAISRAIVTVKLGGRLEFESTPGVGTSFRLTLPGGG